MLLRSQREQARKVPKRLSNGPVFSLPPQAPLRLLPLTLSNPFVLRKSHSFHENRFNYRRKKQGRPLERALREREKQSRLKQTAIKKEKFES